MADLLVKLYALEPPTELRAAMAAAGITIRPAIAPEQRAVVRWVAERFGDGWASEVEVAFAHRPVGCLVAVQDGALLGFACHNATAIGFFGPTGVDPGPARQGHRRGAAARDHGGDAPSRPRLRHHRRRRPGRLLRENRRRDRDSGFHKWSIPRHDTVQDGVIRRARPRSGGPAHRRHREVLRRDRSQCVQGRPAARTRPRHPAADAVGGRAGLLPRGQPLRPVPRPPQHEGPAAAARPVRRLPRGGGPAGRAGADRPGGRPRLASRFRRLADVPQLPQLRPAGRARPAGGEARHPPVLRRHGPDDARGRAEQRLLAGAGPV